MVVSAPLDPLFVLTLLVVVRIIATELAEPTFVLALGIAGNPVATAWSRTVITVVTHTLVTRLSRSPCAIAVQPMARAAEPRPPAMANTL